MVLDLLRVIAVFMILFSHVSITMGDPAASWNRLAIGPTYFSWSTWGEIGVTIFLIVSGLSLELSHGGEKLRFREFMIRRALRIYPVYYLSLLVALSLHALFGLWLVIHHSRFLWDMPAFDVTSFLLTLSGFNAFAGRWGGSLIWSSWFIGVVMSLYVLYPLISRGMRRNPWLCILLLLSVSVVSRVLTAHTSLLGGNPLQWFPLNRVFEFGLGVFFCVYLGGNALRRPNRRLMHMRALTFLSALSFPLFLVHDPFRRIIHLGLEHRWPWPAGLSLFLLLSFFCAIVVQLADARIQEKLKGRLCCSAA